MNNPIFNLFGGMQNFLNQFGQFKNNLQQNGINPQQQALGQAQQMLDSGKMSQDQYNQILNMAQTIRGFMK